MYLLSGYGWHISENIINNLVSHVAAAAALEGTAHRGISIFTAVYATIAGAGFDRAVRDVIADTYDHETNYQVVQRQCCFLANDYE